MVQFHQLPELRSFGSYFSYKVGHLTQCVYGLHSFINDDCLLKFSHKDLLQLSQFTQFHSFMSIEVNLNFLKNLVQFHQLHELRSFGSYSSYKVGHLPQCVYGLHSFINDDCLLKCSHKDLLQLSQFIQFHSFMSFKVYLNFFGRIWSSFTCYLSYAVSVVTPVTRLAICPSVCMGCTVSLMMIIF